MVSCAPYALVLAFLAGIALGVLVTTFRSHTEAPKKPNIVVKHLPRQTLIADKKKQPKADKKKQPKMEKTKPAKATQKRPNTLERAVQTPQVQLGSLKDQVHVVISDCNNRLGWAANLTAHFTVFAAVSYTHLTLPTTPYV